MPLKPSNKTGRSALSIAHTPLSSSTLGVTKQAKDKRIKQKAMPLRDTAEQ